MDDSNYIKFSGIKWLLEMELVSDPQVINAIKLNVLTISKHIKELEILTVEQNRQMLIWLDLSWVGKFRKKQICLDAQDIIQQMLPNFRIRVITDKSLFDKSVDKLRKVISDVKDTNTNINE